MTPAELREALALWESDHAPLPNSPIVNALSLGHAVEFQPIIEAARTIALPILEADPELVERIAEFLWKLDNGGWSMMTSYAVADGETKDFYREKAQELLAAISTPTPGAE